MLGFDRDLNVINKGDTAELYAYLTDLRDRPVPQDDLIDVEFTVVSPDPDTDAVTVSGEIVDDGVGTGVFDDTGLVGEYKVVASFTDSDGKKKSVRSDFEVIDPFNPPDPTVEQIIGQSVWAHLEDLFDSEEGGPWLQDVTMATFKKEKMSMFIAESLFDINQQNPPTNVGVGNFIVDSTPNENFPLLMEGVLLSVIRHLIRSYVEQPLPTGAQIAYEDRRDYLQRWQTVLQVEEQRYMRFLALWKRQFLGLGHGRVVVGSKAGRLISAPMRTRFVGRGYF